MRHISLALVLYCPFGLAANDWRFADPNSQLIAGSSVSPTSSNVVANFFLSRWAPLSRLPFTFLPLLTNVQTVTYSAVSTRLEVVALGGQFDFAAIRSAAGAVGMTSRFYRQIEILAIQNSNREQIALVSNTEIVFGDPGALPAAIDRSIDNPTLSLTNSLIQQSASFASGWDMFAIGSGTASQSFLNAAVVKGYLAAKAPALGTALSNSSGFTFRVRTQTNFRLELNITEPDANTATNSASSMSTIPGQIKATGLGVPGLLEAVSSYTTVTAVGSVIELVLDPNVYSLTTSVSPAGSGSISPNTTGVIFAANSVVTLTATPGSCYSAPSWSVNAPSGVVTMSAPETVTATFPTSSAAAIASSVVATPGGYRLNSMTGRYQQSIKLVNSGSTLTNVSLVFDSLGAGVALYSPDGTTACAPTGSAYRNVLSLPSGSTSVVVEFSVTNPAATIQYTLRVLAGSGTR